MVDLVIMFSGFHLDEAIPEIAEAVCGLVPSLSRRFNPHLDETIKGSGDVFFGRHMAGSPRKYLMLSTGMTRYTGP